jgi:hypothetical protein
MLATTPGGRDLLRAVVDPDLADLVAQLQPQGIPAVRASRLNPLIVAGMQVMGGSAVVFMIDDGQGHFAGQCWLIKSAAGMYQLAAASATVDLAHLERNDADPIMTGGRESAGFCLAPGRS